MGGTFGTRGWPNAAVLLAPACDPLLTATPAPGRLAAGNIMVLPASSGAGGAAETAAFAFGLCGSGLAGADGLDAGGTAKIAVEFMSGDLAVAAGLGAGGDICGAGAAGRGTPNGVLDFPHPLVEPCWPS